MASPSTTRTLDVYEIACLAGGRDRMVDAALVALVQSGRVRVHRPGQLATVSLERRHPVEAAVLDAVGPVGHRSIDTIRWRLADDERLREVARRLRRDGWVARHLPVLSPAGRRVLHRLSADPPRDDVAPGTDAMRVALHGRPDWPRNDPRAEIFVTRKVRHFAHGSRSASPAEAAAENQRDVQRTSAVIHTSPVDWGAPYGPNPSLRATHRGRR